MSDKLKIELDKRVDDQGKTYYIGKLKGPFMIDAKEGIAFLVFTSQEGFEELHLCSMTKKEKPFNDR